MKRVSVLSLSVLTAAVLGLSACSDNGDAQNKKTVAASEPAKQVVIYTNADEEAQQAMKNALDNNGFKGAYLMQSFGTSELGGKLAAEGKTGGNIAAAKIVGARLAEKAKAAGIESCAFDRSGYRYHGRVAALAEAAREAGLKF